MLLKRRYFFVIHASLYHFIETKFMKRTLLATASLVIILGGMPFFGGCKSASSGTDHGWKTPLSVSRTKKGDPIDQPADKANPRDTSQLANARAGKNQPTNTITYTQPTDQTRHDRVEMGAVSRPAQGTPNWVMDAPPMSPEPVATPAAPEQFATAPNYARDAGLPPIPAEPAPPMGLSMAAPAADGDFKLPATLDGMMLPPAAPAEPASMVNTHPQLGGQPYLDQVAPVNHVEPLASTPPATAPTAVLFAPGNINPAYPHQPAM